MESTPTPPKNKHALYSDKYKTTDFVWAQSLGEGAFGNVKYCWLVKDKDSKFAIKAMKKQEIIQSKHVDHIENERKILDFLVHPFIVSYQLLSSHFFILTVGVLWLHAGRPLRLLRHGTAQGRRPIHVSSQHWQL